MEQNVSQQPKPRNNKLWIGCLVVGLIGFAGLVILAGGAYYFGVFPAREVPVLVPATVAEQAATESAATDAPVLATVEITDTPELTPTIESTPPKVELYDLNLNVQYPSLAALADESGNVSILPNQPTILDLRWCAKGESTLSKMTNLLDLTVLINDTEIPVSSFNISQYQTTLDITKEKKDTALCNTIAGLVRNWGEGTYTVKLSLRATAAYNDGWKDHPADELQEFTYNVRVTPTSAYAEWGRCELFEDLKPELVFLDPVPKEPLGMYFKFENGVPGLETEIVGDTGDWEYTAAIDEAVSDKSCTFQRGYEGRLYCKVQITSEYTRSTRPVSLSVNGCTWPVYLTNAQIP